MLDLVNQNFGWDCWRIGYANDIPLVFRDVCSIHMAYSVYSTLVELVVEVDDLLLALTILVDWVDSSRTRMKQTCENDSIRMTKMPHLGVSCLPH